jgi:hypothetical protein
MPNTALSLPKSVVPQMPPSYSSTGVRVDDIYERTRAMIEERTRSMIDKHTQSMIDERTRVLNDILSKVPR